MGAEHNAARVAPPTTANRTEVALTGGAASTAQATGATAADRWISMVCTVAFNVNFGPSDSVAAPSNTALLSPNVVHSFECNANETHFKVISPSNGTVLWWKSSRS